MFGGTLPLCGWGGTGVAPQNALDAHANEVLQPRANFSVGLCEAQPGDQRLWQRCRKLTAMVYSDVSATE